jgi:NADH-quinone oxidoreductase subunit J
MPTELLIFYVLGAGAVLSSGAMILPPMGRNPIHSALYLIGSFFFLAGIYALLAAHLLTAMQIIVYAGAVMVLFTFVIMLLNLAPDEIQPPRISLTKIFGAGVGLFLLGKLASVFAIATAGAKSVDLNDPGFAQYGTIKDVGRMMYTTHMVPFELASVLLLVAAVGAVVLAKRSLKYTTPVPPPSKLNRINHSQDVADDDDGHGHGSDHGHDTAHGHAADAGHH